MDKYCAYETACSSWKNFLISRAAVVVVAVMAVLAGLLLKTVLFLLLI